ncbi:hypothetical protein ABZ783_24745 [Micromonospora sp. NPDC047738]|uniref:hypothetical protein n=1 Tax=Micromonospora sp. NPDC047738 TaxID=3155741 RepID=UPI0033E6C3B8
MRTTHQHMAAALARSPHGWARPGLPSISTLLLGTLMMAVALAGCGGAPEEKTAAPPASPTPPVTASPTPSPTPPSDRDGDGIPDSSDTYPDDPKNIPQQAPVNLQCGTASLSRGSFFTVYGGKDGWPDFAEVWAAKPSSCDIIGSLNIVTAVEKQAYKVSKYDDQDISTLYEICAAVDPEDVYAEAGFAASSEQIPEINAALILCPKHPHAKKWRQAVQRGQADADLEAQGRLFGSGTYRVGKEIKPGTYVTHDVQGCYWERQNSSGNIIDNYFTNGARRVQVTIRSSDYAFNSENCGEWRPAR